MEKFSYDLDAKRVVVTDAEIVAGLKAFAGTIGGRVFVAREFDAWPAAEFSSHTAAKRFGSWREALRRAGIEGGRARQYPPEELIADLERVWRELGRKPGDHSLKRLGRFSANTYRARWGSLKRACELVARHHKGEISREELCNPGPPKWKRKEVSTSVRWKVLKRDGGKCTMCGRGSADGVKLHIDHIVPVSKGGGSEEKNLRTLCRECNQGKRDRVG